MTHALADAVASVPLGALDDLARHVWIEHGAGRLDDDQATALAEAIHARKAGRALVRAAQAGPVALGRLSSIFPPRPRQRPQDRTQSLIRRRTIAASGPMSPAMAARFTTGQLAVLGIVADELAGKGLCDLSIGEIAARAGVSHRLAQGALRLAESDGLISITARPRKGQKSLPNLIRVLSREWAAWLAKRRPTGCKRQHSTDIRTLGRSLGEEKSRTSVSGRKGPLPGLRPAIRAANPCAEHSDELGSRAPAKYPRKKIVRPRLANYASQ